MRRLPFCEIIPGTLETIVARLILIGPNTADMLLYSQEQLPLNKQEEHYCSVFE